MIIIYLQKTKDKQKFKPPFHAELSGIAIAKVINGNAILTHKKAV